jgi:hypothetical protein
MYILANLTGAEREVESSLQRAWNRDCTAQHAFKQRQKYARRVTTLTESSVELDTADGWLQALGLWAIFTTPPPVDDGTPHVSSDWSCYCTPYHIINACSQL